MEYLKCLAVGTIGMFLAAFAMITVSLSVVLGMIGLEWFLGLFGGTIVLPPDVSRGTILDPIILILWGLIVLPCIGWLFRRYDELSKNVKLLVFENSLLEEQAADFRKELASKKTTA